MKFDFQFFIAMIFIGLLVPRTNRAGWVFLTLFAFSWILMSWRRNPAFMLMVLVTGAALVLWIVNERMIMKRAERNVSGK